MSLAKRTAGAPLTEAEHKQRVDAARSRWANSGARQVAAVAVGAGAGALAVRAALALQVKRVAGQLRSAREDTVRPELRQHASIMARHARRQNMADAAVRSWPGAAKDEKNWPVPAMRGALAHDIHVNERIIRRTPFGDDPIHIGARIFESPATEQRVVDAEDRLLALRRRLAALADARRTRTTERAAVVAKPARPHTRNIKSVGLFARKGAKIAGIDVADILPALNDDTKLRALLERSKLFDATGMTATEIAEEVEGWGQDLDNRLSSRNVMRRKKTSIEVNPDQGRRVFRVATKAKVLGNIPAPALRDMGRELRQRIGGFFGAKKLAESSRHLGARAAAEGAYQARRAALVRWIPAWKGRAGLLAAGALLGAGAGWAAWGKSAAATRNSPDRSPRLAKVAPGNLPGNAADIFAAGTEVEDTLADRLARVFRDWATLTPAEMADRRGALRDIFAGDLATALQPLDTAAHGGAGAPVPVSGRDSAGNPRTIVFTFDARSPFVTQAIKNHRLQLAGQMADEQLQTIRGVLLHQAVSGASPDTTARMLRQTIGLAPSQAAHVVSYRQALETLDPRVLTRAIRDKRFDPTITRALATGTPIEGERVDRMVDAYHRRYLALRAMTIARTEGLRAANAGHVAAMEEALKDEPGMTVVKTWIATADERTRHDHQGLNGKSVIGLHTPFHTPSGDFIRWPHDEQAPARQTVNCRCAVATRMVDRGTTARFGPGIVSDHPKEMAHA